MLRLDFLGSGNAFAQGGRYWSSFLVDGRYLFDAPPTLLPHLKRLQLPLDGLDAVFISHLHADHFVGLPFLFLEYAYLTRRTKDLVIVGPPDIEQFMEEFADKCFPAITGKGDYRRVYVEARPGARQAAGDLSFEAVRMQHGSGSLDPFGYRLRLPGGVVAYTGDTELSDSILELARGADVLVADCTYSQGRGPEHMGIEDIRALRGRLPPEMPIILTHLDGEPDLSGLPKVTAARDFAAFELG